MLCLLDHSVKTFPVIPQSATPSDALAICGPHRLAVIVDEDRFPVALMVRTDLKSAEEQGVGSLADRAARLPPSVVTHETVQIDEIFSYNVLPAFAVGARGVIFVSDQGRAVGVWSLDEMLRHLTDMRSSAVANGHLLKVFTDYLFSREPALKIDLLSGILPVCGGSRRTEILLRCPRCGYLNRLRFLDPNALPTCQNPEQPSHQLTLR